MKLVSPARAVLWLLVAHFRRASVRPKAWARPRRAAPRSSSGSSCSSSSRTWAGTPASPRPRAAFAKRRPRGSGSRSSASASAAASARARPRSAAFARPSRHRSSRCSFDLERDSILLSLLESERVFAVALGVAAGASSDLGGESTAFATAASLAMAIATSGLLWGVAIGRILRVILDPPRLARLWDRDGVRRAHLPVPVDDGAGPRPRRRARSARAPRSARLRRVARRRAGERGAASPRAGRACRRGGDRRDGADRLRPRRRRSDPTSPGRGQHRPHPRSRRDGPRSTRRRPLDRVDHRRLLLRHRRRRVRRRRDLRRRARAPSGRAPGDGPRRRGAGGTGRVVGRVRSRDPDRSARRDREAAPRASSRSRPGDLLAGKARAMCGRPCSSPARRSSL